MLGLAKASTVEAAQQALEGAHAEIERLTSMHERDAAAWRETVEKADARASAIASENRKLREQLDSARSTAEEERQALHASHAASLDACRRSGDRMRDELGAQIEQLRDEVARARAAEAAEVEANAKLREALAKAREEHAFERSRADELESQQRIVRRQGEEALAAEREAHRATERKLRALVK